MPKEKDFLQNIVYRLNKSQVGHNITYENTNLAHRILGASSVILSTITSGMLLFGYESESGEIANYTILIIILSLLTSLSTSLLTFLSLERKADLHKGKAIKYGVLKRKVEFFSNRASYSEDEYATFIDKVQTEWDHIAEDSPVTPRKYRTEAKEVLLEDQKHKSEVINNK